MKNITGKAILLAVTGFLVIMAANRCAGTKKAPDNNTTEVINTRAGDIGISLRIEFTKGESHNHPLMVFWLEDTSGRYLETLYIAESIGKGIFGHGTKSGGQWQPGPVRRPAALPYWGHKRGIKAADGYYLPSPEEPMPDAVSGPTPAGDFTLNSSLPVSNPTAFKIMMEINQSWDWNEYWTNNKFPDDVNYMTSSQPSLIYEAMIDLESGEKEYRMTPAGHGHYSGLDGSLDPDLSTLTTALDIVREVRILLD